MRKILWLCILFPVGLFAQEANTLLWKIEKTDSTEESYIYGSIHLADPAFTAWDKNVTRIFSKSECVAGELDMTDMASMMSAAMGMFMKDTTLADLYDSATYARLSSFLDRTLNPQTNAMREKTQPFFLITSVLEGQSQGNPADIIDMKVQQMGKEQGKKVKGLETVGEQMEVIRRVSYRKQAQWLLNVMDNYEQYAIQFADLKAAYLAQDLNRLRTISKAESELWDETFMHHMVEERNYRMAERLVRLIGNYKTFCVVGALHLTGPEGLIALLRARGYQVTPVYFEFEPVK